MQAFTEVSGRRSGNPGWPSGRPYSGIPKRALDLAALALLGPFAVVLAGVAALAVAASTRSTPFFGHVRIGRNGRPFRCWKIKTMHPDADRILARHLAASPAARKEWDTTRKLWADPRITQLGRILRKTSIDELPQLLNVLKGEMSLVGPRPVTAEELEGYGEHARAYLSLSPGITGLWQVSGRNRLSMAERIGHDAHYARSIGFVADMRILLRTLPAMLDGR